MWAKCATGSNWLDMSRTFWPRPPATAGLVCVKRKCSVYLVHSAESEMIDSEKRPRRGRDWRWNRFRVLSAAGERVRLLVRPRRWRGVQLSETLLGLS
jgi:hypothetical protein